MALPERVRRLRRPQDASAPLRRPLGARRRLAEAERSLAAGRAGEAVSQAQDALKLDATLDRARHIIGGVELADYHYFDVLAALHDAIRPRSYLEIGVHNGRSFALASLDTQAVGVDPAPRVDTASIPAGHRIVAEKSDAFFARRSRPQVFAEPVDLAFIDGMHLFEFALRDFMNTERWAAPGAAVVLHDTFPIDAVSANRRGASPETAGRLRRLGLGLLNRYSSFWTGDVWRLLIVLRLYRPDLRITTFPAQPSGLTVVTGLDPRSDVLARMYPLIVDVIARFPLRAAIGDRSSTLGLINEPYPEVLESLGLGRGVRA